MLTQQQHDLRRRMSAFGRVAAELATAAVQ
jgi:hypothetical protein